MLILSIDQSMSCSGYAWLDTETMTVTTGTVVTKRDPKDPHNTKRLLYIYDAFICLVNGNKPDLLVMERYFVGNSRGAMAVGEVRAMLKLIAARFNIPLREYITSSVRKNIVGNGRAEKETVADFILQTFPSLRDRHVTLDETDAVAMAMHAMKVEENDPTQTATQAINHKKKGSRKASQKGKQSKDTSVTKESSGPSVTSKKTKDSGTQTSFKEART